jgi:hypothetical protein
MDSPTSARTAILEPCRFHFWELGGCGAVVQKMLDKRAGKD